MRITVIDSARWQTYRYAVVPTIVQFGGRHITHAGGVERLEGSDAGERIALFEFPSMAAIHKFWRSPEYVPLRELRRGAATLDIWAVPGG